MLQSLQYVHIVTKLYKMYAIHETLQVEKQTVTGTHPAFYSIFAAGRSHGAKTGCSEESAMRSRDYEYKTKDTGSLPDTCP